MNKKIIYYSFLFCVSISVSSCFPEKETCPCAINPFAHTHYPEENAEADSILIEQEHQNEVTVEEVAEAFLKEYHESNENLEGRVVSIREPHTLHSDIGQEDDFMYYPVYADEECVAVMSAGKIWTNEYQIAGTHRIAGQPSGPAEGEIGYYNHIPFTKGCYRLSIQKDKHYSIQFESVTYDSNKQYGDLKKTVYTFSPEQLVKP